MVISRNYAPNTSWIQPSGRNVETNRPLFIYYACVFHDHKLFCWQLTASFDHAQSNLRSDWAIAIKTALNSSRVSSSLHLNLSSHHLCLIYFVFLFQNLHITRTFCKNIKTKTGEEKKKNNAINFITLFGLAVARRWTHLHTWRM